MCDGPILQKQVSPTVMAIVLALCVLCGHTASADTTFAYHRTATPEKVTVGDVINVALTVTQTGDTTATPAPLVLSDTFHIREQTHVQTTSGNTVTTVWSTKIAAFEPGRLTIPTGTLTYTLANGQIKTYTLPPIAITVVSILPSTASTVGTLKPLLTISWTWWPWALGTIGLLVLGFLVWKRIRSGTKDKIKMSTPRLSPAEEAYVALDKLLVSGKIESAMHKEVSLALTDILKGFFSKHFQDKMQELTSEELLHSRHIHQLPSDAQSTLRELLHRLDYIKFANGTYSTEAIYRDIQIIKHLIQEATGPTTCAEEPHP